MSNIKVGKKFKMSAQEGNPDFIADFRDDPGTVMEEVAARLKVLGLEVFRHETNGDFYAFSINRIQPVKEPKKDIWHEYEARVSWHDTHDHTIFGVHFRYRGKDRNIDMVLGASERRPNLSEIVKIRWYPYAKQWMMVPKV